MGTTTDVFEKMSSFYRRLLGRHSRRPLYLFFLWTCMCYVVFRYTGGLHDARSDGVGDEAPLSTRLLLEKLVETGPRPPQSVDNSTVMSFMDAEPLVDKTSLNEDQVVRFVADKIPNLPITYWKMNKGKSIYYKNKTCAKYPNIYELKFNNIYWQSLYTSNGTFHFYNAYYDNRPLLKISPLIRILGMHDRISPSIKTFCHLWFEGAKQPIITPVLEYKYIWFRKWGNYKNGILQPYLLSCQVPKTAEKTMKNKGVPVSVSIVERPCDTSTNNLRVVHDAPEKKKDFAVCVKGLDFLHSDMSVRLVEWLELLLLLGADKVFLYDLSVHPNVTKILDYYKSMDKIERIPLTLPGEQPNIPGLQHLYLKNKINHKRQNELIPYNDCLYRNLYKYKYIALLDTDEIIMPVLRDSWGEMMKDVIAKSLKVKNESRASYNVRNVYFLDDLLHEHGWFANVPRYMHMLQHVYRSRNFTKPGQYVKCFHNPERVLTLHNHFPLSCLGTMCTSYSINTTDAQLQHYRADCVGTLKKSCKSEYRVHTVMDTTIWKYREELTARVTRTLKKLRFLKPIGDITGGRGSAAAGLFNALWGS